MTDSKPLKLGVLLSGGGRTLLNILDCIQRGELDCNVATVIASRECMGVERAQAAGLDVHVVPYRQYRDAGLGARPDTEGYSAAIVERLDAAGVGLVVHAGFLSLWHIPLRYEAKVMNIHPALLPAFGGKGMYGHHVHEAVVATGCKVSGCTVHFVTNEYDAGPIILQRTVPVTDRDTPHEVAERVFEQECIAYPEAIRLFQQGRLEIDGQIVRVRQ